MKASHTVVILLIGVVVIKQREGERLLLTVATPKGSIRVTFPKPSGPEADQPGPTSTSGGGAGEKGGR